MERIRCSAPAMMIALAACSSEMPEAPPEAPPLGISLPHEATYVSPAGEKRSFELDPGGQAFMIGIRTPHPTGGAATLHDPEGSLVGFSHFVPTQDVNRLSPIVVFSDTAKIGIYRLDVSRLTEFTLSVVGADDGFIPVGVSPRPEGPDSLFPSEAQLSLRFSRPVDIGTLGIGVFWDSGILDDMELKVDGDWETREDATALTFRPRHALDEGRIFVRIESSLASTQGDRLPTDLQLEYEVEPEPVDNHPGGVRIAKGEVVDVASDGRRVVLLVTAPDRSCSSLVGGCFLDGPLQLYVVEGNVLSPQAAVAQLADRFGEGRVALNASGDGLVVWTDTLFSSFYYVTWARKLWAQRIANAMLVGPPELLCDLTPESGGSSGGAVDAVSVAVDAAGNAAVSYTVSSLTFQRVARLMRADGGWLPALDEAGFVLGDASSQSVSHSVMRAAGGRVLFAWSAPDGASYSARIFEDGRLQPEVSWQMPVTTGINNLDGAINDDGNAFVVVDGHGASEYHLRYRDASVGWGSPLYFRTDADDVRGVSPCGISLVMAARGDRGWLMSSTFRGSPWAGTVWVRPLIGAGEVGMAIMDDPVGFPESCNLFIDEAGTLSAFWGHDRRLRRRSINQTAFEARAISFGNGYAQSERVTGNGKTTVTWPRFSNDLNAGSYVYLLTE